MDVNVAGPVKAWAQFILDVVKLGLSIGGMVMAGKAADQRVTELIGEIDSATEFLGLEIEAVAKERDREIAQADETLERERTRILAEEAEVAQTLELDIRERLSQHEISEEQAERELANIEANRIAAIEAAERGMQQATESRALTVANLGARIVAGDLEAQRKAAQIVESRDLFISQTRDEAIVVLNKHAGDALYGITAAGAQAAQQVGGATAALASTAVRRTGTPLLALRQVEEQAKAAAAQTEREARFQTTSSAMGYGQQVVGARVKAEQDIETTMAQQALEDQSLNDQIEQAELSFTHTYANLQASIVDINRLAEQDLAAKKAAAAAEETDYLLDIERLELQAAQATAALEAELAAAIEANKHRKEDVIGQADVLTQKYRHQITELGTKRQNLVNNRASIVWTAALTGSSDVLSSTSDLINTINNQTRSPFAPASPSGGGGTSLTE